MSLSNVQQALIDAIEDLLTGWVILGENADRDPPDGKWAQLHFVPGDPTVASLGPSGFNEYRGFMQIDVHYPLGTGDAEARSDADTLTEEFVAGVKLTNEDQEVGILNSGRSQGRQGSDWYVVSISIYWYALIQR